MNKTIKACAKLALFYSPAFIKNKIQARMQQMELQRAMDIAHRSYVNKEDFIAALQNFDFDSDIMLHSSMVNIGRIQGGAKFIASSLLEKIDLNQHTLLISALPYRGSFAVWLKDDYVFDVRTAPIAMGVINERLAANPDAVRSIHPTHSVVAIGKDSHFYTGEHHLDTTPFGVHSPYYKLLQRRAKILLLGATQNNVTFIHAIEDMLGDAHPVTVYSKKKYDIKCIDNCGNSLVVQTTVHSPWAGAFRDCSIMTKLLKDYDAIQASSIGESSIMMFDCYNYTMAYLDYLASGFSIYGKHRVSDALINRIESIKHDLQSLNR